MLKRFAVGFGILSSLVLGESASGSANEWDQKREYPYEIVHKDGKVYRFDRRTGKLDLLLASQKESASSPSEHKIDRSLDPPAEKPIKNHRPVILEPGEELEKETDAKNYVPREISDVHRQRAEKDVAACEQQIGVSQYIDVSGETIRGAINVSYKGSRRLLALELTLPIPLGDKKYHEQRFLLRDEQGSTLPPRPVVQGQRSPSVDIKVEFPAPPGIKGKIEQAKVTYLKFAEE